MATSFSDIILQQGRALEWLTSVVLCGFAFTLWLPGDTLGAGAWSAFGWTEAQIATPVAIVMNYKHGLGLGPLKRD